MPRQKSGNVRINMYVSPRIVKAAKILATRRGTTYSELFRNGIDAYILAELRKLKDAA